MKMDSREIDEGAGYIGYRDAFEMISENVRPVGDEDLSLNVCVGRIASSDLVAAMNYPSIDVSLKDGFAVRSADVFHADRHNPVRLTVMGSSQAGTAFEGRVDCGCAVKVYSGAPIPGGADAVVSGEFCDEMSPGKVLITADAGPGRNILRSGVEVAAGVTIVRKGERLFPGRLGLAAAAGISKIKVYRRPRVAIISVGDEIVAPGRRLQAGQLYASNLITMEAWLGSFGFPCVTSVVPDHEGAIRQALKGCLPGVDAILTSGGAWGSERDLVVGVMDKLGWRKKFHYVRMGPGKGIAFGLWRNVPVFCLPGGPASNETAFLQLALPALSRMGGATAHPLQVLQARLTEDVKGRHRAWTEFKDAVITGNDGGHYAVSPCKNRSRLQAIAGADSVLCIPEGTESLRKGDIVPVQLLTGLNDFDPFEPLPKSS